MQPENQTLGKLRNMTSIYLTCNGQVLLLYRQGSKVVNNVWVGSAGGHFEENELNDAKACVLRELREELHIEESCLQNLSLRYITLRKTAKEIRQNYYFFAELEQGTDMKLTSDEGTLKWFSLAELKNLDMPFSAKYMIEHWLDEGRNTSGMYGGITTEKGVIFTKLEEF